MSLHSTMLTTEEMTSIYESKKASVITTIYICNTGEDLVHFNVYAVPHKQTAGIKNTIYHQVPLTAHDTYVIDTEKLLLEDKDAIFANLTMMVADTTANVVATVSAMQT